MIKKYSFWLFLFAMSLFGSQQISAQTISGLNAATFTEGSSPIFIQPNISITGGSGYGGGYILFKVTSASAADQLNLFSNANPNESGAISIASGAVYQGTGSGKTLVGSVDGVLNGQNGKDLKVNFTSNFANSSFESGLDGWTVGNQMIDLGVSSIAGFVTPNDPTPGNGDSDVPASASYNYELSTSQFTNGGKSLRLYSNMTTRFGCDIVHGPFVYSAPFQSNAGDVLYFDWRAFAGSDAYDVFGYILNVETGAKTIVLNATGSSSSSTPWATASVSVPSTGSYRFVFVSGTSDATCGRAAGASLYIDNVRVFGDNVNASVITSIARNVTYQNTCGTSTASKNFSVSIVKTDNTTASASSTISFNTFAPTAVSKDITVNLNGAGQVTILPNAVDNGSADHCPLTFNTNKTTFTCNDLGENQVVLSVTDSYGNTSTANAVVTVVDNLAPVPNIASLPNITAQCSANVTPPTATDNCKGTITATTTDPLTYTQQGTYTIHWTYTDDKGNTSTQNQTVIVKDTQAPVVPALANVEGLCSATATAPTIWDNCAGNITGTTTDPLTYITQGTHVITWTFNDGNGNIATANQNIVIKDALAPLVPVLADVEAECSVTVTAPTTTDNCFGVVTGTTTAPLTYTSQGTFVITWTFKDAAGNVSTANQNVIIKDVTAPVPVVATLPQVTGQCTASVTAPTATDNCGGTITGTTTDPTSYSGQGTYTVTWTYTDASGNKTTQTQQVVVKDSTPPVISTPFNITVNADPNACGAVVTYSQPSASDNCGSGTLPTSISGFTYKGTLNGHAYFVSNTPATPEEAHAKAIALGGHLATISNAAENAFISAIDPRFIWVGITDREIEGKFKWVTSEPVIYQNWNAGEPNNWGGNEDWAVINWGPNGTWNDWFYTENALYVVEFEGGSIPTTLVSGLGSGATFPVGTTTETWQAVDAGGNVVKGSFTVTVLDKQAPVPAIANLQQVNAECAVTVSAPTANDNCKGVITGTPNRSTTFTAQGSYVITWTYNDGNGNVTTQNQTVVVKDVTAPTIATPVAVSVSSDAGKCGAAVSLVTPATSDNCNVASVTNNAPANGFYPVGTTTVTWTVKDVNGLTTTTTQQIIVTDNELPVIASNSDKSVTTDAGVCGATVAVSATATDNCTVGLPVGKRSDGLALTALYPVGTTTITWTVTDANGNNAVAVVQTVVVKDVEAPVALAQEVVVSLDATGKGSTTAEAVNNGSSDACGIKSLVLSKTSFDCSNVGKNTVTLTVTDNNGNVSTVDAIVTVEDKVAPIALAKNVMVSLDAAGKGSTTAALVNNNSTDACGIASLALSKTTFDCSNVGANTVTLTVTDVNGNVSTVDAVVTVEDKVAPVALAKNVLVSLDAAGKGSITEADVDAGSADACGIASLALSKTSFDCSNIGANTVTLTVTDKNGNVSTTTAVVTVEDKVAPVALAKNIAVTLVNGSVSITPAMVDNGSNDACGIKSLTLSRTSFDCSDVNDFGSSKAHTVTLTVTDNNGNVTTTTAEVTVNGVKPVASIAVSRTNNTFTALNSNTIALGYGAQSLTLTASNATVGVTTYAWSPAAGLSSTSVPNPVFTPTAAGTYTYTVTVTNEFGCSTTKQVTLTVIDARCASGNSGKMDKVLVCHNGNTICIAPAAVQAHLAHGCSLGACNATVKNARTTGATVQVQEIGLTAYPNPTAGNATIEFTAVEEGAYSLEVYDMAGALVSTIAKGKAEANKFFSYELDAARLAQGVYLIKLSTGKQVATKRLVITK